MIRKTISEFARHSLRAAVVNDSVLYHSLLGLASPQQTTQSIVRDGKYWLKWIAAQWHSWTLARFPVLNISGEEFEDLHEQREPVGKAPDFYDQNPSSDGFGLCLHFPENHRGNHRLSLWYAKALRMV